jgi:hypothetical protein
MNLDVSTYAATVAIHTPVAVSAASSNLDVSTYAAAVDVTGLVAAEASSVNLDIQAYAATVAPAEGAVVLDARDPDHARGRKRRELPEVDVPNNPWYTEEEEEEAPLVEPMAHSGRNPQERRRRLRFFFLAMTRGKAA